MNLPNANGFRKPEKEVEIFEPIKLSKADLNELSYTEMIDLSKSTTAYIVGFDKSKSDAEHELKSLQFRIAKVKMQLDDMKRLLPVAEANIIIIKETMEKKREQHELSEKKKQAQERVLKAKLAYEQALKELEGV